MKRKLIVFIFLISLSVFVLSLILQGNKYNKTLKVGVSLVNLVQPLDPMSNPTLTNAFFSNNLYSGLVFLDDKNSYNLDLASRYWFDDKAQDLFFEIKNTRITPEDAAFTLKRIIFQGKQLHADLKSIICSPSESLVDCTERVSYEGDLLRIKYFTQSKARDIVPILASVDYKIVPISAFDSLNYKVAQIVNYEKTSGHYHLQKRDNRYFLIKNKGAALNIYDQYEVVDIHSKDLVSERASELIDSLNVISTTVPLFDKAYLNLKEKKWNVFYSHNIGLTLAVFSNSGIKKTSSSERFDICARITEELKSRMNIYGSKLTVQFFQNFSNGFLNETQLNKITQLRMTPYKKLKNTITLGANYPERLVQFQSKYSDIKVVKIKGLGYLLPEKDQPDVSTLTNDISFDLSLSVISYAANSGLLILSKQDLKRYADLRDVDEQIAFINAVHFDSLLNAKICPMFAVPYTTAFDKPYQHSLSKFNSRTLLWMVH